MQIASEELKMEKKKYYFEENHCTDSVPTDSSRMKGRNTNQPSGFLQYLFKQMGEILILLIKIQDFDNQHVV